MSWPGWLIKENVDHFVSITLSPDIKVMPKDVVLWRDGELSNNNPMLFDSTLRIAVSLADRDNNPLLLDALRKKWPEAVENQLPEARRRAAAAPVPVPA
jgi:hypothetical protein